MKKKYGLCKLRSYMDAHPIVSEIKILVDRRDPKKFVLPEDKRVMLILDLAFIPFGIMCLFGIANILTQ